MPSTGIAVCSGWLGTYDHPNLPLLVPDAVAVAVPVPVAVVVVVLSTTSQVRVCARKGALPVRVGPAHSSGYVWKYCGTFGSGLQSPPSDVVPGPGLLLLRNREARLLLAVTRTASRTAAQSTREQMKPARKVRYPRVCSGEDGFVVRVGVATRVGSASASASAVSSRAGTGAYPEDSGLEVERGFRIFISIYFQVINLMESDSSGPFDLAFNTGY
jgi:hypothetical protein